MHVARTEAERGRRYRRSVKPIPKKRTPAAMMPHRRAQRRAQRRGATSYSAVNGFRTSNGKKKRRKKAPITRL